VCSVCFILLYQSSLWLLHFNKLLLSSSSSSSQRKKEVTGQDLAALTTAPVREFWHSSINRRLLLSSSAKIGCSRSDVIRVICVTRPYTGIFHNNAAIVLRVLSSSTFYSQILRSFTPKYDAMLSVLWPPCVADADIIFLPCNFNLFYSSPNLSGRRLDVYHTSTHGVALVRI